MARMAGSAGTQAAVQIHTADALIGPAFNDGKFQFAGGFRVPGFRADYLELCPVTIIASLRLGGGIGRLINYLVLISFWGSVDTALKFLIQWICRQIIIGMRHNV